MNYEAWRMTYQDSEQAARAAFKLACELSSEVKELKNDKLAQDAAYNAMMAQRDYLDDVVRKSYGWIEGDTEVLLRDLLHGQVGYYEMYESVERLRIIIGHGLKYICSGYDENEKQA